MLEPGGPFGQRLQPFGFALVDHAHKLISLFGGVVEEDHMVSARDGDWRVPETALIAATDICFWNVVTPG